MLYFLNFLLTFLAFYFVDGASTADAAPVIGAIVAISQAISAMGIIGKILLTVGLTIGQTLLQKALKKKKSSADAKIGVQLEVQMGDDIAVSGVLGTYASAGKRKYIGTWGKAGKTPNAYLVDVVQVSDIPVGNLVQLWLNDKKCTISTANPDPDGKGYAIAEFTREGVAFAWWKFYDGKQTVSDPYLLLRFGTNPDHPWKPSMIGRGCAYVILTYRVDDAFFSNSLPSPLIVTDGAPLYDLRKDSSIGGVGPHRWDDQSTWSPSDNPFVQAYNIARGISYGGRWFYGGQNVVSKRLPPSAWVAAMNACDVTRPLGDGSSEPMFRSGVEFQGTDEPLEIIDRLRSSANGRIVEIGGKLKAFAGELGAAELAFTDSDIIITEGQSYEPFPNLDDTHNGATATYPEPAEKWATKDAAPYYSADFEAADGDRRLIAELQFPCAPYAIQVQALLRAAIEEARRFRTHQFYLPPHFWVLEPGDIIAWSSAVMGYANKKFIVISIEGEMTYNQFVTLREVDPTDYSWSPSFQQPVVTTTPGPILLPAQNIDGWTVTPYAVADGIGDDRRAAILVAVADDLDDVASVRVQVRVKSTGELVHDQLYPYLIGKTYSWVISNPALLPGETYEVRGLLAPKSTRPVDWTVWTTVVMFPLFIDTKDVLDDAITANKIADAAITAAKIMDDAVTALKLADLAVATASLQVGAVTADVLASNAVIASKIADGAIIARTLANGAVDATKFAAGIEPVTVITTGPLPTTKSTMNINWQGQLYTWNGTAYVTPQTGVADGSITANKLADAAVTAAKLAALAVTNDKIAANAIYGSVIAAGAITARELTLTDYENLVPNGSFDIADVTWQWEAGVNTYRGYFDRAAQPTLVKSGQYSFFLQKVDLAQAANVYANTYFKLSAGEDYWFETAIMGNDGISSQGAYVRIQFYDVNKVATTGNDGVGYVDIIANGPITAAWVTYQRKVNIPAGVVYARARVLSVAANTTARNLIVDRIVVRRANAAKLIVDGAIVASMLAVNSVTAASIAAGAIGVDQLAANAITTAAIAAGAVTASKIAIGLGSNYLFNTDFSAGGIYWGIEYSNGPAGTYEVAPSIGTYTPAPYGALLLHYNGSDPSVQVGTRQMNADGTPKAFTCIPGVTYEFSYRYFGHRAKNVGYIAFFDANGTLITYISGGEVAAQQNFDPQKSLANYPQYFFTAVAPAGAVTMYPFIRNSGVAAGQTDAYLWVVQLYFGQANAGQTTPTRWADGSATIINGGTISALSITAASIAANAITAGKIAANAVTAGTIAAGAVVAASIAASTITGDKIAANTIGANNIAANAITAKTLVLTDYENLVPNGFFKENDLSYYDIGSVTGASISIINWPSLSGTTVFLLQKPSGNMGASINFSMKPAYWFGVTMFEQLYCEVVFGTNLGGSSAGIYFRLYFYDANKTILAGGNTYGTSYVDIAQNAGVPAGNWIKYSGTVTVPSGAVFVNVQVISHSTNTTAQNLFVDRMVVRRAKGAELIVAGTVTADKLNVNSLTAISANFGNASVTGVIQSVNGKMQLDFNAGTFGIWD